MYSIGEREKDGGRNLVKFTFPTLLIYHNPYKDCSYNSTVFLSSWGIYIFENLYGVKDGRLLSSLVESDYSLRALITSKS